ncbi:MAG: PilN domain-containing protein [Methylococcaceae bacterium]|jgi:type IV pilus assembly protein PilN
MTKINLLPWRQELLKKNQKEFINTIILSTLVSCITLAIVHTYINTLKDYQEQRNQLLLKEITILDLQIVDIKNIEEKKRKLLTKIDLIQKFQESRPLTVHLFDEIPRILPDGVYLTKIIQTGTDLIFEGKSPSNARVSDFMKAIEASPWLQKPGITIIKLPDTKSPNINNPEQLSDFTLRASQEQLTQKTGTRKTDDFVRN